MYVPELFAQKDVAALHDFMRQHSFATLITQHEGEPFASHLHVVTDSGIGAHGALVGHMARNNPQWQDFEAGADVLAIFHGPHAYVSGGWYAPNPMAAPTWNYAVVHAYGKARILSEEELVDTLHRQVDENEQGQASPWKLEMTPALRQRALPAIVGFEIALTRIEGKFKLGQNRSEQDRRNVIARLAQSAHGQEVAHWMEHELEKK